MSGAPSGRRLRMAAMLALLAALVTSACAASRMGQAAVRLEQGQPCFGLADDEARGRDLRLAAIVLSDVSAQPARRVWTLSPAGPASADDASLPLPPGRCVRPDQLPAGYVASAAPSLQPGRLYEVFVNAPRFDGRRDAQGFTQRFCLAGDGSLLRLAPNASRCAAD